MALPGDLLAIQDNCMLVNDVALPQTAGEEACPAPEGGQVNQACRVLRESNGSRSYAIMLDGNYDASFASQRVPAGHVFVVGDNRNNSRDSRHFGPVPLANLVGKPTLIFWSMSPSDEIRWARIGQGL